MSFLEKNAKVDKGRHQRLVEKLIYLTHISSDLTYAISMVS